MFFFMQNEGFQRRRYVFLFFDSVLVRRRPKNIDNEENAVIIELPSEFGDKCIMDFVGISFGQIFRQLTPLRATKERAWWSNVSLA